MGPVQLIESNVLDFQISRVRMSYQEMENDALCIYLSGRLDARTIPQIEQNFMRLSAGNRKSVIVDLSGIELMNSAGLGMLIMSANELNLHEKLMILLNPSPRVRKVITMACLDSLLPIVDSLSEAKKKLGNSAVS